MRTFKDGETVRVKSDTSGCRERLHFAIYDEADYRVRTFTGYRRGDISATHTADQMNAPDEPQYFGAVFPSGKCVINWATAIKSVSVFDSLEDMMKIHGHLEDKEYETEIVWND